MPQTLEELARFVEDVTGEDLGTGVTTTVTPAAFQPVVARGQSPLMDGLADFVNSVVKKTVESPLDKIDEAIARIQADPELANLVVDPSELPEGMGGGVPRVRTDHTDPQIDIFKQSIAARQAEIRVFSGGGADEEQLAELNRIRVDELGFQPVTALRPKEGFKETVKGTTTESLPLSGELVRLWKSARMKATVRRLEFDTATAQDYADYADYMENLAQAARGRTPSGEFANILRGSLKFGAEIGLTGGLAGVGKATAAGVAGAVRGGGTALVRRGAARGVTLAAETAARLPAFSAQIKANQLEKSLDTAISVPQGKGDFEIVVVKNDEPSNIAAEAADTFIQLFSEETGRMFAFLRIPGGKRLAGALPQKVRLSVKGVNEFFRFHGLAGELGEEVVAKLMQDAVGLESPTFEQLAEQAPTFAAAIVAQGGLLGVVGAGIAAAKGRQVEEVSKAASEAQRPAQDVREAPAVPRPEDVVGPVDESGQPVFPQGRAEPGADIQPDIQKPPAEPAKPVKAKLLTTEGADAFVKDNPKIADKVAAAAEKGDVSRKGPFAEVRKIDPDAKEFNLSKRNEFGQLVKEALETQKPKEAAEISAPEPEKAISPTAPVETETRLETQFPTSALVINRENLPEQTFKQRDMERLGGTNTARTFLKKFAQQVPGFKEDPTFTVTDGKLVHKDGGTFTIEPVVLGIDPETLAEGQIVAIDLESINAAKPIDLESVRKKRKRGLKLTESERAVFDEGKVETAGGQARRELGEAVDDFGKFLNERQFANPLDPEIVKRAARIIAKAVKAGVLTFNDFVQSLRRSASDRQIRRLAPTLQKEWNALRAKNPKLDEAGDIEAILPPAEDVPSTVGDRANIADTPEGKRFVDVIDEQRDEAGKPGVLSDAEVHQQATARLKKNGATKERANLIAVADAGHDLNPVDTVVAKQIAREEQQAAIESDDLDRLADAAHIQSAWRDTGTAQARSLRLRQNFNESRKERNARLIREAWFEPDPRTQNRIKKARKKGDADEVKRLMRKWAEQMRRLKQKLKDRGIDLDDIDKVTEDDVATARVVGQGHAIKSGKLRPWIEFWLNAILSGPQTLIVNFGGNFGHGGWYLAIQKPVEVFVSAILPRQLGGGAVSASDLTRIARGIMPGLARGWKNSIKAWQTELPVLEVEHGREAGATKFEQPRIAISGTKGKIVRSFGFRPLVWADELYKTMVAYALVGTKAALIARTEGKTGDALESRVDELVQDERSEAWQAAIDKAQELAFQKELGQFGKAVQKIVRNQPAMRFLLPFTLTPANIFKLGVRKSPLGVVGMPFEFIAALRGGSKERFVERSAETLISLAIMAAIASTLDPEEPWITGAASGQGRKGRAQGHQTGLEPMTIQVGDTRYSYARVEPLATGLSIIVDAVLAVKSGKGVFGSLEVISQNLRGQVKDKTYLRGISDILNIIEAEEGKSLEAIARWASNFATSWIPNLIRSPIRSLDDKFAERRVWGDNKLAQLGKRTLQKTELFRGILPDEPKVDLWGREVDRGAPNTGAVWDILSPIRVNRPNPTKGDQVFWRWSVSHPKDDPTVKLVPLPSYTVDGERIFMTESQYTQFLKLAGGTAKLVVDGAGGLDVDSPDEFDVEMVEDALTRSRTAVRERLVREWSGKGEAPDAEVMASSVRRAWRVSLSRSLKRKGQPRRLRKKWHEIKKILDGQPAKK